MSIEEDKELNILSPDRIVEIGNIKIELSPFKLPDFDTGFRLAKKYANIYFNSRKEVNRRIEELRVEYSDDLDKFDSALAVADIDEGRILAEAFFEAHEQGMLEDIKDVLQISISNFADINIDDFDWVEVTELIVKIFQLNISFFMKMMKKVGVATEENGDPSPGEV